MIIEYHLPCPPVLNIEYHLSCPPVLCSSVLERDKSRHSLSDNMEDEDLAGNIIR